MAGQTPATPIPVPRLMWAAYGRVCARLGRDRTEDLIAHIRRQVKNTATRRTSPTWPLRRTNCASAVRARAAGLAAAAAAGKPCRGHQMGATDRHRARFRLSAA